MIAEKKVKSVTGEILTLLLAKIAGVKVALLDLIKAITQQCMRRGNIVINNIFNIKQNFSTLKNME